MTSNLFSWMTQNLVLLVGIALALPLGWSLGLKVLRNFSRFKGPARYSAKPLMTGAEQRMFGILKKAFPEMEIMSQVAMGAIVQVASWQNKGKDGWRYRAAFSQKILDYVVYDSQNHRIVCVVELDDKSHEGRAAQARDAVKNDVLNQAGVPWIRFDARSMPDAAKVRKDCLASR